MRSNDEVMHNCEVQQDYVLAKNNLYCTNISVIRFHPKKVPILTHMVEHHQNTPKRCYIYQNNAMSHRLMYTQLGTKYMGLNIIPPRPLWVRGWDYRGIVDMFRC